MMTDEEILAVVHLNRALPTREIRREWNVGRFQIVFHWQSSKNLWGRFGGGWNWELGFQIGGSTVIVNLLICSLRFSRRRP